MPHTLHRKDTNIAVGVFRHFTSHITRLLQYPSRRRRDRQCRFDAIADFTVSDILLDLTGDNPLFNNNRRRTSISLPPGSLDPLLSLLVKYLQQDGGVPGSYTKIRHISTNYRIGSDHGSVTNSDIG